MRSSTLGIVLVLTGACVGSDPVINPQSDGGSTCKIDGNYSVTTKLNASDPGTCAASAGSTTTVTLAKQTDGTVLLTFQGLSGNCPGGLVSSACVLTTSCDITLTAGGDQRIDVTATITDQGMTGTDDITQTSATGQVCTQKFNLTATRQ